LRLRLQRRVQRLHHLRPRAERVRIVGVIDLKGWRAVHARAGDRERYQPVSFVHGDPLALVAHYRARGVEEIYVADLDAIAGGTPQDDVVRDIVRTGMPVSLDAGISSEVRALHTINTLGVARVIVGLETLPSFEALDVICISIGGEKVAFSLDLRNGEPVMGRLKAAPTPVEIAGRAVQAGVGSVIVIDLARVGTGSGLDFDLLSEIRRAAPDVSLIAGGGVRGQEDLDRLEAIGCDGALVATMLQRVSDGSSAS
jgi:phosphoribosylformimino-5-aminoimidazole carboxamide ribotide isomerase